ncbi:hypothetical protein LDENG_00235330 [Lucifuga dentata]|nr:hypothetical protein LDENG_00235330 [Lucifuga dentata]
MKILEHPSQSPDLNPTEMLRDLKQAVHAWKSSKVSELKQFSEEEELYSTQQRQRRSGIVVAAKCGTSSYLRGYYFFT